jgi:hypothetical protein
MKHDAPAQLQRMLASRLFVVRPRMAALLRFFVEESLRNGGGPISQQSIAAHALPLPDDFQPTKSAYVRTHVARLRRALRDYYATTGRHDPLTFSLTQGPYRLVATQAKRREWTDGNGRDPAGSLTTTIPKRELPTLLLVEPEDGACLNGHTGIGRNVAMQLAASLVESPFVTAAGPLTRERLATHASPLLDIASVWGYDYVCDASIAPDGTSGLCCAATATDVHHRQHILEDATTIRADGPAASANGIAGWLFHRLSNALMIKRIDTHGGTGG